MASLTLSHNISGSNIGITPSTILTLGCTYSIDGGETLDTFNFYFKTFTVPLDAFPLNSTSEGEFTLAGGGSAYLLASPSIGSGLTRILDGTTIHYVFGVTLIEPNLTSYPFLNGLIEYSNKAFANTISSGDNNHYGVWGSTGLTNYPARTGNIGITYLYNPITILSNSATGTAGSTIGITIDSLGVDSYFVGIGTGSTFYGIVSLLGCTSGITLNSTNLTVSEIENIKGEYLTGDISGSKQNKLRSINVNLNLFKRSISEFVIPNHIPSGSYYLTVIPSSYIGIFSLSNRTSAYADPERIPLPRSNITITNNFVGLTSIYQINPSAVSIPNTNNSANTSKLFSYVDNNDTSINTLAAIFGPSRRLFDLSGNSYGITTNLTSYSFNPLDYGSSNPGDTLSILTRRFQAPIFGFIPVGLTVGQTMAVLLNGITFYEKQYNPYINYNSAEYRYSDSYDVRTTFNALIADANDTAEKRNLNNINRSFYRVDFNNFSNPWGFTGFTFSQVNSTGNTLSVKYFNSGSISNTFDLPILLQNPSYTLTVPGNSNFISIHGGSAGVTIDRESQISISCTSRPLGYLEKLNFYDGSGSFIGGITLADNRTVLGNTGIMPARTAFGIPALSTVPSSFISAIGRTGTAKISFIRSDGVSYEYASNAITTTFGTYSPVHILGDISGLTIIETSGRNIAPAVDLMRITVNHGLTNIEDGVIGRDNIYSRYLLTSNIDNVDLDGNFTSYYFSFILASIGPEQVVNNSINVTNRSLRSFRAAALEREPALLEIAGTDITIPLRNYVSVVGYTLPNDTFIQWPVTSIEGNSSLTQLMDYFNGPAQTEAELLAKPDPLYYQSYDAGYTLMFDNGENPQPEFNGGEWYLANPGSFLRYSSGNTFYPSTAFTFNGSARGYINYIFYDYRITGLTLSSTTSVGLQDALTTTITVNDLPHASIFDGLRLQVISGGSEIFGKNILYSTSDNNDYRIPGYSTIGITNFAAYYTATPRSITSIFVGSGVTLGGITITPPSAGWPASDSLTVRVSPLFKSFINISDSDRNNPSNNYIREATFTTATAPGGGGGGGGSAGGSISVSESVVTGVAFTNVENDFYAGFLCGVTAYNIITNNSTSSFSIIRDSSNAYANARAALDAGSLLSNTTTDFEIHSLLNYMDYGGNAIISPTVDGLLGSNYEYDVVFCEDNKRYGELMRIGSEKNHAIVIVGTSLEEDAASFTAPAYTNLNSAGLVDGLTFMTSTSVNKGEYVFSVLGYKNRTRFYGSGTDTVRLYLSSDVAGSYARSYVENKYHLSSSGSARGSIKTYSSITPTIVDRDLAGYYSRGINPIYIPSGTNKAAIWGDATGITTGNDAYRKSASVAKNTSTIKREFKKIFEDFQFEQNNAGTRAQFVSRATTVLDKLQSIGGLSSYTLTCNETNNTPAVVAQKRLVVDLVIVPNNSIESIVLNFVLNQI
jgi:hypothetical protein